MQITPSLFHEIERQSQELFSELIAIRRHLHSHPELSFEEWKTSDFISQKLKEFGINSQETKAGTGIVARIKGNHPDKECVALRADIDALPIEELNDVDYKSQNKGIMHACGHDVHTTCLLGAAKVLQSIRDQFEGTVQLIFQPGEEKSPGGASLMIAAGALDNPQPKAIFGLHVDPSLPSGFVGFRPGMYMASSDEIHIRIFGKGGHAALPHLAVDPIAIAALTITALQQVISRKANPLIPSVLTFGKIAGGFATNVIPDEVEILGTFRTFDESWREKAKELIQETVQHIAMMNAATAEVIMPFGYPTLFNHPELTKKAILTAESVVGKEKVKALELRMTSEDFAFYSQKANACFFRLGTNKNHEKFNNPVHNPHFDIDESAIVIGVRMMCLLALKELEM